MNLSLPQTKTGYSTLSQVIIVAVWILLTTNILWSLNKGLIFHDESWELLHYRNGVPTIDYSNWHRVLKFLYVENLIHLRLITFSVISLSAFFLGYVSCKVFKFQMPSWIAGLMFIIFQFFLYAPVKLVPSYTNMNSVVINISVSFFLLFVSREQDNLKLIYLFLSGFFISTLPFILVTNTLIIALLGMVIFMVSESPYRIKYCVIYVLSLLIYPFCYFTIIQSPDQFWGKYKEASHYLTFDSDYGLFGIVKWHLKWILHLIKLPLPIFLISIFLIKRDKIEKMYRHIAIGILTSLILIQLYQDVTFSASMFSVSLWYVLLSILLLVTWKDLQLNRPLLIIILFLITLPYFASLGTVVRFQFKATSFFSYIALGLLCMQQFAKRTFDTSTWSSFLFVICTLTFFSYNFRSSWTNYRTTEQTEKLHFNEKVGHIMLDPYRVAELESLKPYMYGNEKVMVSHENLWGYVYLLNAKPLYLPFRFKEKYFYYYLDKNDESPLEVTYVEMKRKPFSSSFKKYLSGLHDDDKILQIIDLGQFIIYRFV